MIKYALPLLVLLGLAPLVTSNFYVMTLTEILVFALFAMSLDIQVGYARMFSFGHAAPYGVGAYIAAFALLHGAPLPLALVAALVGVFALAIPVGWLCTRASGVAFAMLTLAFAQLAFAVVFKADKFTGGSDGLSGLLRNAGPFGFDGFASRDGYYWLTLIVVFSAFLVTRNFMHSPMGTAIVAARESEKRAHAIGYEPRTLRLVAFVASYSLAGLAGGLHAGFLLFVSPELIHWGLSGQVLVAVVLGGAGTLVGPMLGAAVIVIASHQLSSVTDSWPLFMGIMFIVVVVAAPKGLWGIQASIASIYAARKASRLGNSHVTP